MTLSKIICYSFSSIIILVIAIPNPIQPPKPDCYNCYTEISNLCHTNETQKLDKKCCSLIKESCIECSKIVKHCDTILMTQNVIDIFIGLLLFFCILIAVVMVFVIGLTFFVNYYKKIHGYNNLSKV